MVQLCWFQEADAKRSSCAGGPSLHEPAAPRKPPPSPHKTGNAGGWWEKRQLGEPSYLYGPAVLVDSETRRTEYAVRQDPAGLVEKGPARWRGGLCKAPHCPCEARRPQDPGMGGVAGDFPDQMSLTPLQTGTIPVDWLHGSEPHAIARQEQHHAFQCH